MRRFDRIWTALALTSLFAALSTGCADLPDEPLARAEHALVEARAAGVIAERVSSSDVDGAWSRFLASVPELTGPATQVAALAVGRDALFVGLNTRTRAIIYRSDQATPIAVFDDTWVTALAVGDVDGDGVEEAYFGLDTRSGGAVRRSPRGRDAGALLARPDATRAIRALAIGDPDGDGADELVVGFATDRGAALAVSDGRSLVGYVWGPHLEADIGAIALRATGRDLADELYVGLQTRAGAELWRGDLRRPLRERVAGPRLGAAYTALSVADVDGRGAEALFAAVDSAAGAEIIRGVGATAERLNATRYAAAALALAVSPAELLVAFDDDPGCPVGINPEPKLHPGINPEPKACISPEPKQPVGINPEPKQPVGINPEPKLHGGIINPDSM